MASDGDDPLADAYNLMGAQGMTGPNPYLQFTGQIPMAGFYGAPTNAGTGAPIDSFTQAQQAHDAWNAANPAQPAAAKPPGTTLNSAQQLYNQMSGPSAMNPTGNPAFGASEWGFGLGVQGAVDRNSPAYQIDPSGDGSGRGGIGGQPGTIGGQAQQTPATQAQNPVDMRQAYLDALSNPGKVNTPGAQISARDEYDWTCRGATAIRVAGVPAGSSRRGNKRRR